MRTHCCAPAILAGKEERNVTTLSITPDSTLEQRLAEHKASLEQKAAQLKPGPERDHLLQKIRAADINEWINSTGLQAPK
jgi:hypothetical protein